MEIRSTLPGMLFLNTIMRQLYDLASPCIEHEEACLYILKQIENLGREVEDIMGVPKPIPKRKVFSKFNCNEVDGVIFRDPKHIIDEQLKPARTLRQRQEKLNKGLLSRKKKNDPPATPLPTVPCDYIPVHPSTAPPKVSVYTDDGLDMVDESFFYKYSQL